MTDLTTSPQATKLLEFTIPGNPGDGAVNAVWRSIVVPQRGAQAARVRVIVSAKGKKFRSRAIAVVRIAMADAQPVDSECSVVIRNFWPRQRHLDGAKELPLGDVDATAKAVLDAMEAAGFYDDDCRVRTLTVSKALDRTNPRIEVEVWADMLPAPEDKFHELERAVDAAHPSLRRGFMVAFATMFDDVDCIVIAAEVVEPTPPGDGLDLIQAKATKVLLEDFGVRPLEVVLVRAGSLPKSPSAKLRRRATRDAWAGGRLERL